MSKKYIEHYEECEYPFLYDQELDAHEAWQQWALIYVEPGLSDEDMRFAIDKILCNNKKDLRKQNGKTTKTKKTKIATATK